MQKTKLNHQGFGVVAIVATILVLAAAGGTGYLVWHKNHESKTKTSSMPTGKPTIGNSATSAFSKLPENWTEYKNDANGFRVGYPTAWGVIDVTTLQTPAYANAGDNLDGKLTLYFSKKDDFSTVAQKYGATIKPAADGKQWIVVDENPAAADGYKVGDIYKTVSKPVNGGRAIDLSFTDEECQQTHFVLELKHGFVGINLPELCGSEASPITDESKDAYTKLVSDFLKTIAIY